LSFFALNQIITMKSCQVCGSPDSAAIRSHADI
jgi:hypothetical protein